MAWLPPVMLFSCGPAIHSPKRPRRFCGLPTYTTRDPQGGGVRSLWAEPRGAVPRPTPASAWSAPPKALPALAAPRCPPCLPPLRSCRRAELGLLHCGEEGKGRERRAGVLVRLGGRRARLQAATAAPGRPRSRDAAGARDQRAAQRLPGHVLWPRSAATMSLTARVSCSMLSCFVSASPVCRGVVQGLGGRDSLLGASSPAQDLPWRYQISTHPPLPYVQVAKGLGTGRRCRWRAGRKFSCVFLGLYGVGAGACRRLEMKI